MKWLEDIGSNIGRSITGNIEKAKLTLYDYRYFDEGAVKVEDITKEGKRGKKLTLQSLKGGDPLYTAEVFEGRSKEFDSKIETLINENAEAPKRNFIVKFNPNTMSIQGTGGGKHYVADYSDTNEQSGLSYKPLPTRVQFSVELLFDTTQNFEFTKKTIGALGKNSELVSKIQTNKETVTNSVRKQVEGFIAALRHPRTRVLEFNWGYMCYKGTLNSLDVQYTMFSPEGYPLRAKVRMGMTLVDEKIYKGNMGQWEKKVRDTFPSGNGIEAYNRLADGADPKSDTTDNRSKSQYVNSLFNISL